MKNKRLARAIEILNESYVIKCGQCGAVCVLPVGAASAVECHQCGCIPNGFEIIDIVPFGPLAVFDEILQD